MFITIDKKIITQRETNCCVIEETRVPCKIRIFSVLCSEMETWIFRSTHAIKNNAFHISRIKPLSFNFFHRKVKRWHYSVKV